MSARDVKLLELESELGRAVENLWGDVRRLERDNSSLVEQRDLLEARLRASEDACASLRAELAKKKEHKRAPLTETPTQTEVRTITDRAVSVQSQDGAVAAKEGRWKSEAVEILELQQETIKALQTKYRRVLLFADELQRKLKSSQSK